MKVLIIGGKRFVGYHIAKALLADDHEVVFFNRGRTNTELFPGCENIIGDRNEDLDKLEGLDFDYVIDTCAYFPKQVDQALDILEGHFKKYVLISSIAVVDPDEQGFDETVKVHQPDYESETVTGETYGALKAACEEVVTNRLDDNGIIIRPGYIVGHRDYTDRFSYYPVMMHFMDEVMMPETEDMRYSFVDGKDLGRFVVHSLINDLSGIYHTVGPMNFTFKEFLEITRSIVNPNCTIHYVDRTWLEENDVSISQAFPTCNFDERGRQIFSVNTSKARNDGFTTRPVADSVRDALAYYLHEKGTLNKLEVGMSPKEMKKLVTSLKK